MKTIKDRVKGEHYIPETKDENEHHLAPNQSYTNYLKLQRDKDKMAMKKYAVYAKNGKYWRVDGEFHSLRKAKEIVKSLRSQNVKAFYKAV